MIELAELIDYLEQAAKVEQKLSDKEKRMLGCKAAWPDYLHDREDRSGWIEEPKLRLSITSAELKLLDAVSEWLRYLKHQKLERTILSRRIVWAKSNGFSYREIAFMTGLAPQTCKNYYDKDILSMASLVTSTIALTG